MTTPFTFDEYLLSPQPDAGKETPEPPTKAVWEPTGIAGLDPESAKFLADLPVEGETPEAAALRALNGEQQPPLVVEEDPTQAAKERPPEPPPEKKLYTEEEQLRYVQLTLAGKRFTKEYTLFDGKMRFTFRELNPRENSAAVTQISREAMRDEKEREFKGQTEYFFLHETYLCLMAVEKFKRDAGDDSVDKTFPPVFENKIDPAKLSTGETVLRAYANKLTDFLFPTSALLRLVLAKYREFVLLCGQLDEHASRGNF